MPTQSQSQMQMQTLVIRVLSLKDQDGDFVLSLDKKQGVRVYCDAFEHRQEVESLSPLHGLKIGTEVRVVKLRDALKSCAMHDLCLYMIYLKDIV